MKKGERILYNKESRLNIPKYTMILWRETSLQLQETRFLMSMHFPNEAITVIKISSNWWIFAIKKN
jgi:hypothetical protein